MKILDDKGNEIELKEDEDDVPHINPEELEQVMGKDDNTSSMENFLTHIGESDEDSEEEEFTLDEIEESDDIAEPAFMIEELDEEAGELSGISGLEPLEFSDMDEDI